jgi:hypothetical protein
MAPRFALLILLCLLSLPARLAARDLFVSNATGNDTNDGASATSLGERQGPFRTISRALRAARNGDRIIVENTGAAYHESLTLQAKRHSGVEGRPFVLVGNGAVLDGTEPVPPNAWEVVENEENMFRFPAERKSFHILYRDGKPVKRQAIAEGVERVPQLEPLEWCLHEGYVYFCTERGKLPWSYELTHTVLPVGITLYEVRHVLVQDLIVQGFQLDGINAHDGATDVELVGLTARGNGRSGISIGGASRVTLEACLVGDNGVSQVRTEGVCHARIINCDLIDRPTAPALDQQGGEVTVEGRVARATVSDEDKLR